MSKNEWIKPIGSLIPHSYRHEKYFLAEIEFHPISLMTCFHVPAANVDKYLQPNWNNKPREKRYHLMISEAHFSKDPTFQAHPICKSSVSLCYKVSWLSWPGKVPGESD